jgi:hypothetical protein
MTRRQAIWAILATPFLAGCATLRRLWPTPELEYRHKLNRQEATTEALAWTASGSGRYVSQGDPATSSMRPYIMCGDGEFLLMEQIGNTEIRPGLVLSFRRDRWAPRCLHMVTAVNKAGTHFRTAGTNNERSDYGWHHRSSINGVARVVVTWPVGVDRPAQRIFGMTILAAALLFGHPVPAEAGEQRAGSDAKLLAGIHLVENPRGLIGAAGEHGPYHLLPTSRAAAARRLRERGVTAPAELQLAREHLAQIRREYAALGVADLPFNLALAWNAGATAAARNRAPESSYDYAQRVMNLMEDAR